MKKCLLAFLFIATVINSIAQYRLAQFTDANRLQKIKATQAAIDELYRQHAQKNNFPSLVYGVVADGQLLWTGSIGYTDVAKKVKADSRSVFRVASMSKSFTALAILQLRDSGLLQLDDPAETYIPELKDMQYPTADAPKITIRQLLTHAAGFPEDNPWGDRQLAATDAQLLQIARAATFSTTPGTAYEYSNLGFSLLGLVIKKITGVPYQQYITQHILQPLGMAHSFYEWNDVPPALLAHGYRQAGSTWTEEALLHDGAFGAMGGLMTSIEDFSRYMALHLSAWPPRNTAEPDVIKRSSLREMQQAHNFSGLINYKFSGGRSCPTTAAYGYGLRWMTDCEDKTFVGHSGGLPGFGSNWTILPRYGIGVVCVANLTYAPTANFNLFVLDTLVKMAGLQPRSLPPSGILQQRKNELVRLLPNWKQAAQSGIFAENFFDDHPIEALHEKTTEIFKAIGPVDNVQEMVAENWLRGSFVVKGKNGSVKVSFTLTPQEVPLIQELHLLPVTQ